jgi:hypothetical protein
MRPHRKVERDEDGNAIPPKDEWLERSNAAVRKQKKERALVGVPFIEDKGE